MAKIYMRLSSLGFVMKVRRPASVNANWFTKNYARFLGKICLSLPYLIAFFAAC